jgi:phage shock protein A
MLESLREAFRQAIENFQSEMNRDRIPEAADRLLRAMQHELVDLKRQTEELAEELERTREEAGREQEAAKTCARREEMARKIEDGETASVANEYALKHLRRHEILSQKVEVLSVELDDRRRNLDEMTVQFREARLRRESLSATVGRADTRETMRRADELFHEMDRMADRIRDLESRGAAGEEIDEMLGEKPSGERAPEPDLDARLEALKRRMGRE